MGTRWLKGALFAGMTGNAFKLSTALTLGWFWMRSDGCSVLYRGVNMEQIDFANVLTVAKLDAESISPPSYLQHNSRSIYYYVVHRINSCGDEEQTLGCAVKISLDSEGELKQPQPNSVFEVIAEQVSGNKVKLFWYYCPVDQKSAPACFNVYYDGRTGQIDYEEPLASIRYVGRMFYSYQSNALDTGTYLFAIRAEDAEGIENESLGGIRIQLGAASPDAIDILGVELA